MNQREESSLIHSSAADGYRQRAHTYQQVRPLYHPDLVDLFVADYGTRTVVELGAGTGIFTRQLADAGLRPIAIEPVVEMRNLLCEALPEIDARDGTAEAIPVESASVDTVVVAQAFHWFDHEPALTEIHRVLRAGGHLVTVWNVRDETVHWIHACTRITDLYESGTPRHRTMIWRQAIDADSRFEPVDEWHIDNPTPTTVQGVVDRALSVSFIAALDDQTQEQVVEQIRSVVGDMGATFDFPYRSELQAWRRSADGAL